MHTCPRCRQPARWEGNEFRPFCSDRCKMIDLGAWADEAYAIPSDEAPPFEQADHNGPLTSDENRE